MNPKIGTYAPEGTIFPTQTITGKPFQRSEYDAMPPVIHDLIGGHFAVGEVFLPRDFDVEAALQELNAELSAKVKPSKAEDKS